VQAGAGGVRPGWGLRRLGELPGAGIAQELRAALYQLFEATHETIDLSTLSAGEVLFMDRFLSDQPVRALPAVGAVYPAYTMSSGKALLAVLGGDALAALYGDGPLHQLTGNTVPDMAALQQQLDAIRAGGFAYDREEHALGKCAIGLPVGTHRGVPLAISVVMPSQRLSASAIAWKRPCAPASSVAARVCGPWRSSRALAELSANHNSENFIPEI
jgi:DNA-binding IclR family transcriptional regulator